MSRSQSLTSSTSDTHNAMHPEHPQKTNEDNKKTEHEEKKEKKKKNAPVNLPESSSKAHSWISQCSSSTTPILFLFSSLSNFLSVSFSKKTSPSPSPWYSVFPFLLSHPSSTSFTAHHLLISHPFKKSPHLNHHHGKVVVSLACVLFNFEHLKKLAPTPLRCCHPLRCCQLFPGW